MCLAALAMFTACSNDIEYTEPNNKSDEIQFVVANIDMPTSEGMKASRADGHNHIAWNDAQHANTLGVFGFCDGNLSNVIFDNQKVTYSASKWVYKPAKYWPEFAAKYSSFDFFGYMLEDDDLVESNLPDVATVTKDGSNFTLSFPATLSSPILTSGDNTPLICQAPYHTTVVGMPIPFQMDQTLTGYDVQFKLGEKMSNLRYFVIKAVKIYGENLPVGGTVSRTYTLTDGNWSTTQAPVTWAPVTKNTLSSADAVSIASDWVINDKDDEGYAKNLAARTISAVNNTTWMKWGDDGDDKTIDDGAFYAIPHADFQPTIEVTYDVYTDADANGKGGTLSRKDVKSTIVLNKTNFESLVLGTTGEIQHINIKIVPDYLYVLSDDDQITGFLIAN